MNPLSIIESWIASEMLNDPQMQALVGNRIYFGSAEQEAGGLYVLCSYVDSEPFYNLGTKRNHAWGWYDIVAWQSGQQTLQMKQTANRLDELFSNFRNRTFTQNGETYRFYSRSTRLISRKDITEPPLVWRGMGGTYKVSATKQS